MGRLTAIPAWVITLAYVILSGAAAVTVESPSDSALGLAVAVGLLLAFCGTIVARGDRAAEIIGTVIAMTALLQLLFSIAEFDSVVRAALAITVIPLAVAFDRRHSSAAD